MQDGSVATSDAYQITGRVLVNGINIGADTVSVSGGRDIPSGMPGSTGFQSATYAVTAVRGDDITDRVAHPWGTNSVWPPKPGSRCEIFLGDGPGREWRQIVGTVKDVSGSSSSQQISFSVQDHYQPLNRTVNMPALSDIMPALTDGNYFRYCGLLSSFIVDWALRQAGRHATPPTNNYTVAAATFQGSTWPERGTLDYSIKQDPDGIGESFPNWQITDYGRCVQNVDAQYEPYVWSGTPGGGRLTSHPVELTQEVVDTSGSSLLRTRFAGGGAVALAHSASTVYARYYRPDGSYVDMVSTSRPDLDRVAARFWLSGGTLHCELRGRRNNGHIVQAGTGSAAAGTLTGVVDQVRANGGGAQGAFQVSFTPTPWERLSFTPSARFHFADAGINSYVGFRTQLDVPAVDLVNDIADAELAQWWIDENDVLQWWDRGLLSQQPTAATLTSRDHVTDLSWSYDHDSLRHAVHVKYERPTQTSRWRRTLTLWQGGSTTLDQGDEDETFINVPDDEIWLGVHVDDPYLYVRDNTNYWQNRGVGTVLGGIAIDEDGNERRTSSIIQNLRKVTDETFVIDTEVRQIAADEQVALQYPNDAATDTSLWHRWLGEKLPLIRGKKRVTFSEASYTSEVRSTAQDIPDYTHDVGEFIQSPIYAGLTADYIAEATTRPNPRLTGVSIMPVLNLQVGDRITLDVPDVVGLRIDGVVTSLDTEADLSSGVASQAIDVLPISVTPVGATWNDFAETHGDKTWQAWAARYPNDTWADFGADPLK